MQQHRSLSSESCDQNLVTTNTSHGEERGMYDAHDANVSHPPEQKVRLGISLACTVDFCLSIPPHVHRRKVYIIRPTPLAIAYPKEPTNKDGSTNVRQPFEAAIAAAVAGPPTLAFAAISVTGT